MDIIQHPCHPHILNMGPLGKKSRSKPYCQICDAEVEDSAYSRKDCRVYIHKACAELPLQIQRHIFHPEHPITLVQSPSDFVCSTCKNYNGPIGRYGCEDCNFYLDLDCALSIMPCEEGSPATPLGITTESLRVDVHEHLLTPFVTKLERYICQLCEEFVTGEGYICLASDCEFFAHQSCIRSLYYEDGSRIPRVAHDHQLFAIRSTRKCKTCKLKISGEGIGCSKCKLFYHRHCVEAPDNLKYPFHRKHTLTLTIVEVEDGRKTPNCRSCGFGLADELVYSCRSCHFFLHICCALRVLRYLEEGGQARSEISWHEHRVQLCHRSSLSGSSCSACGDSLDGWSYVCSVIRCGLLLHASCAELTSEIQHQHHQKHPLVLVAEVSHRRYDCDACHKEIEGFRFSCLECDFSLDVKCASKFPDRKHVLHDHKLTYFEELPTMQCNVCGDRRRSALFRCVPCDFNIHQECMQLPGSVKHKSHWHTLFLCESYIEDDSGEYYCEICEDRRNPNLGAYVCKECKSDNLFIAHISCALSRVSKPCGFIEMFINCVVELLLSVCRLLPGNVPSNFR